MGGRWRVWLVVGNFFFQFCGGAGCFLLIPLSLLLLLSLFLLLLLLSPSLLISGSGYFRQPC